MNCRYSTACLFRGSGYRSRPFRLSGRCAAIAGINGPGVAAAHGSWVIRAMSIRPAEYSTVMSVFACAFAIVFVIAGHRRRIAPQTTHNPAAQAWIMVDGGPVRVRGRLGRRPGARRRAGPLPAARRQRPGPTPARPCPPSARRRAYAGDQGNGATHDHRSQGRGARGTGGPAGRAHRAARARPAAHAEQARRAQRGQPRRDARRWRCPGGGRARPGHLGGHRDRRRRQGVLRGGGPQGDLPRRVAGAEGPGPRRLGVRRLT